MKLNKKESVAHNMENCEIAKLRRKVLMNSEQYICQVHQTENQRTFSL